MVEAKTRVRLARPWRLTLSIVALLPLLSISAAALNRVYKTDAELRPGVIVMADPAKPGYVQPAKPGEDPVGVVVPPIGDYDEDEVVVAGQGQPAQVYVSDINGPVQQGDAVAVSGIEGIGAKAAGGDMIIGVAQADFEAAGEVTDLTDSNLGAESVMVASVPITIDIYQDNRGISPRMIYIGLIVLAVAAISLASYIVLRSFRYGLTAIGRNPMAHRSIMRGLTRSTIVAIVIVTIVGIAVVIILG